MLQAALSQASGTASWDETKTMKDLATADLAAGASDNLDDADSASDKSEDEKDPFDEFDIPKSMRPALEEITQKLTRLCAGVASREALRLHINMLKKASDAEAAWAERTLHTAKARSCCTKVRKCLNCIAPKLGCDRCHRSGFKRKLAFF